MTSNDTLTIKKSTVIYAVLFVIAFLIAAHDQGLFEQKMPPRPNPSGLVMSEAEARLTKHAIEWVRHEVIEGRLNSADLVLKALSAELLESVRERVLKALGQPDIAFMRDALDRLEGKIEVR